jgi:hypothetical protein
MTREAALLNVPTLSVFAGRPAAVDAWLEARGRLRRLEAVDDLPPIVPRDHSADGLAPLRARGRTLVGLFVDAVLAPRRPAGGS